MAEHLGGVPLERIRLFPSPGFATEADVTRIQDHEDRLCELIDGTLVEKAVGAYECRVASIILRSMGNFVDEHKLGDVLGADATLRILPHMVRIPDVSFLSWEPLKKIRRGMPVPRVAPDLAVEVLSESNTRREMERKLKEYFRAGVRLVWYVDPATRTAEVFTSPTKVTHVTEDGSLDGGKLLPGFSLSLREVFAKADRYSP